MSCKTVVLLAWLVASCANNSPSPDTRSPRPGLNGLEAKRESVNTKVTPATAKTSSSSTQGTSNSVATTDDSVATIDDTTSDDSTTTVDDVVATPSSSATPTPSNSTAPTPSNSAAPTVSNNPTPFPSNSTAPTPSNSATPTASNSAAPTATPSNSPAPTVQIQLFNRIPVQTTVAAGTRTIKFAAQRITFLANEALSNIYFAQNFGFTEKKFVLEGAGSTSTILDFTQSVGIAIPITGDGIQFQVKNLAMEGRWQGLTAANLPLRYSSDAWYQLWSGWNKAILVRADQGTVTTRPKAIVGPDVKITGFYYGVTAEEAADADVNNVAVYNAGDAAYFAYYGGRLNVVDSSAERSADLTKGLGHGFVAETLYYESSFDTNKAYKIRSCRQSPSDPDPTISPYLSVHQCLANLGRSVPDAFRSQIITRNSYSNLHLYAGFVANLGATIEATYSRASNAIAKDEYGNPLMYLSDNNLSSPQPFAAGAYDAGSGFVSRYGSRMTLTGSYAFNNLIGFLAWANAEIGARETRSWNNSYFGYHATRSGRIDAVNSGSFGRYQKYGYGVDVNDSTIRVDSAKIGAAVPSFCLSTVTPCPDTILPEAITGMSTTSQIRQSTQIENVLGFFYVQ